MTARFSVVEKSELFELSTVLAPEFPGGLCWNPWVGGGEGGISTALKCTVPTGCMCSAILKNSGKNEKPVCVCVRVRVFVCVF